MIPEGLVLLTSTVLALGVIKLAMKKVLVQDLYCIEALARVDTICLDKTGTITEGIMEVVDIIKIEDADVNDIVANMNTALDENNPTGIALKNYFGKKNTLEVIEKIPFNSSRKYSGVEFTDHKYLIGAPEFILKKEVKCIEKQIDQYNDKYRVLLLCEEKKEKKIPLSLILLQDKVRKEAKDTLEYFKSQGVKVKIISGDNPKTVYNIALRAGLDENSKMLDASTLKTDEDIYNAIEEYDVFGRVNPDQKRKFILALQRRGHSVAMTGDGVNDVLALKEADCSVAMASGTDAAKNVSQLVLLDSNFASMPSIVDEGRRSINNIQRSASLFIVKTIYASVLAVMFLFINKAYPFIPIQLTFANVLSVGIPSVILALEPNYKRVEGNFLVNVVKVSLPPALCIIINILILMGCSNLFGFNRVEISTLAILITVLTQFYLLFKISYPFNQLRFLLFSLVTTAFLLGYIFIGQIFNFAELSLSMIGVLAVMIVIVFFFYPIFVELTNRVIKRLYKNGFMKEK